MLARAEAAADLVGLINDYRRAPSACAGRRAAMAPPLAPSELLAGVAPASPGEFAAALRASGYAAAVATTLRLTGPADAAAALRFVAERHCAELLDPRWSQIGVTRAGNVWRINLAKPLLPDGLGDWRDAGEAILAQVNAARAQPRQCGSERFAAAAPLGWNEGARRRRPSRTAATWPSATTSTMPITRARSVGQRATAAGYRMAARRREHRRGPRRARGGGRRLAREPGALRQHHVGRLRRDGRRVRGAARHHARHLVDADPRPALRTRPQRQRALRIRRSSSRISRTRADRDRAVGDVERREVRTGPVHLDEVDDVAVLDPVEHVADRAAEDERERPAEQALVAMAREQPDDEHRRDRAEADEEPALPAARAGEERRTRRRCCGRGPGRRTA
jgi:uncharacterized protein YkwD